MLRTARLETLLMNLPGMTYRCLNEPHWPMDFVSQGCFDLCGYQRTEIENQSILWGGFIVRYHNVEALKGISLQVDEGDFVTLIGSNGAGKSLRAGNGVHCLA